MMDSHSKIQLHGGPWNNKQVEDLGFDVLLMAIATKWEGSKAAAGARIGSAVYEPSDDRKVAFWLENQWEGVRAGNQS